MLSDELIREKIVRLLEEASDAGRPLDVDEDIATLVDLPLPVVVHHVTALAERLGLAAPDIRPL